MNRNSKIIRPGTFLAADWGKDVGKRAVYKANIANRTIERVDGAVWDLHQLLIQGRNEIAQGNGPVIIAIDVALGVPKRFFRDAAKIDRWARARNFIEWLALLGPEEQFWDEIRSPDKWSVEQPFFSVPAGKGSLNAFYEKAGYRLLRSADNVCGAKSPFIVSGIPGSVGSGTRNFWRELTSYLGSDRDFKIWPFEGNMEHLLKSEQILIAESYPAISYTSALSKSLPGKKLTVAKTKANQRNAALSLLSKMTWPHELNLQVSDLMAARESDDDFDALMTAAGAMRCILSDHSLDCPNRDDRTAEGGMLLMPSVNFEVRASSPFVSARNPSRLKKPMSGRIRKNRNCPITGCKKVFKNTRSGWDAHAGSPSIHPNWYPNEKDPKTRRKLFKSDFPSFFK